MDRKKGRTGRVPRLARGLPEPNKSRKVLHSSRHSPLRAGIVPRIGHRAAKLANGLLLLATTLLLMWGGFEFLFPRILAALPLNLQPFVPKPFIRLCQSSKAGVLPRNWIALFGDSYAEGSGDWLHEVNPWRNPPFQAAHLIHEALGADVVNFGHGGAGSADSLVTVPLPDLAALRARFDVADPRLVLAYFYEGNDLEDNAGRVRRGKGLLREGRLDAEAFDALLRQSLRPDPETARSGSFLATRFTLGRNFGHRIRNRRPAGPPHAPPEYGAYNKAALGGGEVTLPKCLQGPAPELNDPETDLALEVFERSLRFLRNELRGPQIAVVYVPSVLSCYTLHGSLSAGLMTIGARSIRPNSSGSAAT